MSGIPFDFSKPPHPKTLDLLLPLIPGLFFEISIYWAKPEQMSVFAHHSATNTAYYFRGAIALFCAYFLGLATMLSIAFIQNLIKACLRMASKLLASIKKMIYAYTGKRMSDPNSKARKFLNPIQGWWIRRDIAYESAANDAYQVWADAAEQLLKARYGISPPTGAQASQRMAVWHDVLGTPTAEEVRGSSFLRAMYGAGWLGLIATQIAPTLWNRYYIGLSGALVLHGFVVDFLVAKSWCNRVYDIDVRTRCVLREIPLTKSEMAASKDPSDHTTD